MKPIKLSHAFSYEPFNLNVSPSWIKKFIRENFDTEDYQRDCLQDCESSLADPFFAQLQSFLLTKGFASRRAPHGYFKCSFVFTSGCVMEHSDDGFGLCAGVLLHKSKRKGYDDFAQLLTRHGGLSLRTNDVFVFNASKWHAWLCNVDCLLATMTVKKIPRKKATQSKIPQS